MRAGFGPLADELPARDPERFLTVLFAPPEQRDGLIALYHFNTEIAGARHRVSEPMIGEIRLQWWREALDEIYGGGPVRAHPTVEALAGAIKTHALPRAPFEALIDARALDLYDEPFEDIDQYLRDTSSTLMQLASHVCGGDGAVEPLGVLTGALNLYTAAPLLRAHGPYPFAELTADFETLNAKVRAELERALNESAGTRLPKAGRAAFLPAVLARAKARHLLKGKPAAPQPPLPSFRQQLALMRAKVTGRV